MTSHHGRQRKNLQVDHFQQQRCAGSGFASGNRARSAGFAMNAGYRRAITGKFVRIKF
jgi:hypothetical protein